MTNPIVPSGDSWIPSVVESIFHADELDQLHIRLAAAPPDYQIRAIVLASIEEALSRVAPDEAERYDALRAALPSASPFSYRPIREVILQAAAAGRLALPKLPLAEASNELVVRASDSLMGSPLFAAMKQACEGDIDQFFEDGSRYIRQLYSRGDFVPRRDGEARVYEYHDMPADALELLLIGYFDGAWQVFGHTPSVHFERLGPTRFDVVVRP